MSFDNRPGGPDGPPKQGPSTVGKVIGILVVGVPGAVLLIAIAWIGAWLLAHWPT